MTPTNDSGPVPSATIALALSGGGYRATLFGLGSLCRLNELGLLKRIRRISSVSGGSILAGYLGFRWQDLSFDATGVATNFGDVVVQPLRTFCAASLDAGAIVKGLLDPFRSTGDYIVNAYQKRLFTKPDGTAATLQDLPHDSQGPRFVLCATSLQTRACVRFSRPYIGDFNLGRFNNPNVRLAVAVAASSAFPPVLSPVRLQFDPTKWTGAPRAPSPHLEALRSEMVLTDGGVYDNLGLEPIWPKSDTEAPKFDTVLVSDAGAPADIVAAPPARWAAQLARVRGIMMEQTRALRRRMLIRELNAQRLHGAYWGIATKIDDYELADAIIADGPGTHALQNIRTRLNAFSEREQCELINWGYALADAALRRRVQAAPRPSAWPAPGPFAFRMRDAAAPVIA